MKAAITLGVVLLVFANCNSTKNSDSPKSNFAVIAYYAGNATLIDSFEVEKLTHIIYSFCHLKGNRLSVDNAGDSATIKKLVSLKSRNPNLKVMLSLGGWGGCEFCSQVFSTDEGRKEFASSTKELTNYFGTNGIDLDWEYPAIQGYPDHQFKPEDRPNFTALVKELRDSLGKDVVISFAAGGFDKFFAESVEWDKVMPLLDMVNLMTYDLVHGGSTVTGHLTALYSTDKQVESVDRAVSYLDSIGVPKNKMIVGSAFYARTWENVDTMNNGLYQPGKFKSFVAYGNFDQLLRTDSGFNFYRDPVSKAAYAYSPTRKVYATFDDTSSVRAKTLYAREKGLGGIMFWELTLDKKSGGLLDIISRN